RAHQALLRPSPAERLLLRTLRRACHTQSKPPKPSSERGPPSRAVTAQLLPRRRAGRSCTAPSGRSGVGPSAALASVCNEGAPASSGAGGAAQGTAHIIPVA